jgi:hypothetical protein
MPEFFVGVHIGKNSKENKVSPAILPLTQRLILGITTILSITISSLFTGGGIIKQDVAQTTPYATSSLSQQALTEKNSATIATTTPRTSLKDLVGEYFADAPDLVDVARCESHFRQFDNDGRVLRGAVNKGDIGVMQINEYYHADEAKKLGYDLYTIDGNLAYARFLYEREGLTPWLSSSRCWKGEQVAFK